MPVPRGGGAQLAEALVRLIEDNGGTCRTGAEVESIVVRDGDGDRRTPRPAARRSRLRAAVIANVTPTQLYGRLLGDPAGRGRGGRPAFPLRTLPRCRSTSRSRSRRAGRATSGSRRTADRPRDARPRRRLARRQRGRARPAPGRGDRRLRPAAGDRSEPRAGRQGDALDPAPGAALAREGRRGRRARHRRRDLDGGSARALRRPDPGAARTAHPESRVVDPRPHVPLPGRPPGGEPEPRTTATRTPARSRSTRTSSGGRSRAGRATARAIDRLWHIGASTWPGPGLGAGSGTLVAQELLRAPRARAALARVRALRS